MATLNPINPYEKWDQARDIIQKNKANVLDLYSHLDDFASDADLTRLTEVVKQHNDDINKLVGSYAADDIGGSLDSKISVIANIVIIKDNLTAYLKRLDKAEADIIALQAAVQRIINDGIGGYKGTYAAKDNDDSSNLPVKAELEERAIIEYAVNDVLKYQEWIWKATGWEKLGGELNSHIHSQSAGISLVDVANQQDPKNLKLFFAKADYDVKEITITPALYGWVKITDLWTNADKFKKYEGKKIKLYSSTNSLTQAFIFESYIYNSSIFFFGGTDGQGNKAYIEQDIADTVAAGGASIKPDKIEIWDIITPAVKATVLVKK